jgi:hypothetical protein
MQLVIGNGFLGIIRKVKIFQYPKVRIESEHNMRLWSKLLFYKLFKYRQRRLLKIQWKPMCAM